MDDIIYAIEKPWDEFGNVGYIRNSWIADYEGRIYPVIAGTKKPWEDPYPAGYSIVVLEPPEIKENWPTVSPGYFAETEGPARWLTYDELRALWVELGLWPPRTNE